MIFVCLFLFNVPNTWETSVNKIATGAALLAVRIEEMLRCP